MSLSIENQALLQEKSTISLQGYQLLDDRDNGMLIKGILADIGQLGFTFSGSLLSELSKMSESDLTTFHENLVNALKTMVGDHVSYHPLFNNFPHDIPNDSDYLMKRILGHFETFFGVTSEEFTVLSCGHIINSHMFNLKDFGACPVCQMQVPELLDTAQKKPTLNDTTPFKIISLGNEVEYYSLITSLCYSKTPLSEPHRQLVVSEVENNPEHFVNLIDFEYVSQKETLAIILGEILKNIPQKARKTYMFDMKNSLNTMTDVLRVASYLSDGDVSLKENTYFKLKNFYRRFILEASEHVVIKNIESGQSQNTNDDLLRHKKRWLKLMHHIHVNAHVSICPFFVQVTKKLRNDKMEYSYNGLIETNIEKLTTIEKHSSHVLASMGTQRAFIVEKLISLLKKKPGVFGRYLDVVLRNAEDLTQDVVDAFESVSNEITTPNLLKMIKHFENRSEPLSYRPILPKGSVGKIKFLKDDRKTISEHVSQSVVQICLETLFNRFSEKESMGKVFVSPELKNHLLPFSQRSLSSQFLTMTRGSRLPFDEKSEAVRFFLYWKESFTSGRVDVDLSTVCFDEHWNNQGHISYTRLRENGMSSYHSGDIQSAPNGASEFIDVHIDKYLQRGIRYVLMSVNSYTGQPFEEFEAFAGFMERQNVCSGENFEPKTVKNKFSVEGVSVNNVPIIIDLKNREIIWGDLALKGSQINNVENNSEGLNVIAQMVHSMREKNHSLYDLLTLHASARADVVHDVYDPNVEYDYVFDSNFFKNIDEISSIWMS